MTDSYIVTMLRFPAELEPHIRNAAADAIDRLRKERDEARRRVCEMLHEEGYGRSPEEWAKRKGWDCFKENKEKTNGYR
jgi:hypothetical protein